MRWGPQTTDEMMLGYVEYYLASEDADANGEPAGGRGSESRLWAVPGWALARAALTLRV